MARVIRCVVNDCESTISADKWSKIKSQWFFNRDMQEVGYCPDHIPDWVISWRQQRKSHD